MRNAIIAVTSQFGWFACVWSGAHDRLLTAIAGAAIVIAINLWLQRERLAEELRLIVWVTLIGFVVETIHLMTGVFAVVHPATYPWLCPVWLLLLWPMFATVLHGPLGWLSGRYGLSLFLGAVFAAPNYFAGARLGAVKMNDNTVFCVTVLVVIWAIAMPAMVWLSKRPAPPPRAAASPL